MIFYLLVCFCITCFGERVTLPYTDLTNCNQLTVSKLLKYEFIHQQPKHVYVINEKVTRLSRNKGYAKHQIYKCIDAFILANKRKISK